MYVRWLTIQYLWSDGGPIEKKTWPQDAPVKQMTQTALSDTTVFDSLIDKVDK